VGPVVELCDVLSTHQRCFAKSHHRVGITYSTKVDTLYILTYMTTKIQKWGNSLAVRIPNEFAENLNLSTGSVVSFEQLGSKIIISPSRPKYTLEELVAGITPKNRHKEFDWGKPMGKEIW